MNKNKLMPILAKAVVTLVITTISTLGLSAQAFDRQVNLNVDQDKPAIVEEADTDLANLAIVEDLDTDLINPAIVEALDAELTRHLEVSEEIKAIEYSILDADVESDSHIYSELTVLDEVPGEAVLEDLPNTILDGENIQVIDVFDTAETNNY